MTAHRPHTADRLHQAVDRALERTIVLSFSRAGIALRRRAADWDRTPGEGLQGRRVVITGATSGIGRAAARQMAARGAEVVGVGRSARRGRQLVDELTAAGAVAHFVEADLTDLDEVRGAAADVLDGGDVDVLIHNAGAIFPSIGHSPQGIERTVALHVVAPFLLTALCLPALRRTRGRVIAVTSGGMYTAGLDVEALADPPAGSSGTARYALAKRAQVALVEQARTLLTDDGIEVVAMHPGWVDTPGLSASLPRFRQLLAPLLRRPEEGADTVTWLAAAPAAELRRGALWLDRAPRPVHRGRRTRPTDTAARREALWQLCEQLSGAGRDGASSCAATETGSKP